MNTKRILTVSGFILMMIVLSGCPSENKLALEEFIAGNNQVLVSPVHLLDRQKSDYDAGVSRIIADYINEKKYATASVTDLCPPPFNEWKANEASMLSESINLTVDFVKKSNLPANTYFLYPEFLRGGKENKVMAVHYCLIDNKGEVAMRGLINSHWDEFKSVNPVTNEDCVKVFINGFENKLIE